MADVKQTQGTTLEWTSAAGDYVMTMTSLASGSGRAGVEADMGATFPERVRVEANFDFLAAPTAGLVMNVYLASSQDGTDYDGEATGADVAYDSEDDAMRLQFVGALHCSNGTDPQRSSWVAFLTARYVVPVVMNQSGQALTATGTDQWIKITPLIGDIT